MNAPSSPTKPPAKRIAIICNPFAGKGLATNMAQEAQAFCQAQNWQITATLHSQYAGQIENEYAGRVAQNSDLIILIGGDGTLRELIAGLRKNNQDTEIGFIPMGNANVVARELNIPLEPHKALNMLQDSKAIAVDLGVINMTSTEQPLIFLAMLEIGFGAKIVHLVNQLRIGKLRRLYQFWGDMVYAIAGILAFAQRSAQPVTLTTDTSTDNSGHIVIANMQTYAKGWSLTPEANCQDGKLDVAAGKRNSRLATIACFIAATRRKASPASRVTYSRTQIAKLSGSPDAYMQVDGDPVRFEGEAEVSIEAKAFSIHIPN